jgi:hypothetical protein
MSGGHFDYNQYVMHQIADDIEQLIHNNNVPDEWEAFEIIPLKPWPN